MKTPMDRRLRDMQRRLTAAQERAKEAERAAAAYPGLQRQAASMRADLVRLGALLAMAAPHVHDRDLQHKIAEALGHE